MDIWAVQGVLMDKFWRQNCSVIRWNLQPHTPCLRSAKNGYESDRGIARQEKAGLISH